MKHILYLLTGLIFVACTPTTKLSSQAKQISVVYEKPIECKMLGKETGQKVDVIGSMSLLKLRESALNDLKNKASNAGGNTLHITSMEKGWNSLWNATEYLVDGDIYECKSHAIVK